MTEPQQPDYRLFKKGPRAAVRRQRRHQQAKPPKDPFRSFPSALQELAQYNERERSRDSVSPRP